MSWKLDPAVESTMKRMHEELIESWLGTFDPDPYYRRAKYEKVPVSSKMRAKLEAAEQLLYDHGAILEAGPNYTETKKTWLETEEEFYARLATLPERRVDWIRDQLAQGKKPPNGAWVWDLELKEALFGSADVYVTFGHHPTR